jgi:plasmid maintenance system antidote protein VapI
VNKELELLKGVHPGIVLEKKLKESNLKKGKFALSIQEYPQTLTAITKGKRSMNLPLALKIEASLGLEEGYFMLLQLYYDIRREKLKEKGPKPNLSKFRKVIFWDTDMSKIDWMRQAKSVISRVYERGNEQEKKEITRFYGKDKVLKIISDNPKN